MTKSNTLRLFAFRQPAVQSGFTLVEIMIGLTIGMLATLVVMQVFSVFEVQKRATTGAADAVTNGNIALYKVGRDLQQAGYGLISLSANAAPLNCAAMNIDAALAGSGVSGIMPVSIIDNVSDADTRQSDTIIIRYGSTNMGGVPTTIKGAGASVAVKSTFGCSVGDVALVMNKAACAMTIASAIPLQSTGTPSGTIPGTIDGLITLNNPAEAVVDATLSCLDNWSEITYEVNANILQRQDPTVSATFEPSVSDIVNIQAQYGVSASPKSNQVNQWVDATGIWDPLFITPANRNRIKAVRIAIVARDAKLEPGNVTVPCNTATNTGLCAWVGSASSPPPTIDLSADVNWQRYRYRVYNSIIPLRNVIWSSALLN